MAEGTRTYLVERKHEKLRVTVPADWKVTFGPVQPGREGYGGDRGYALRFYETKEKQRAVFTDVVSFRDLSLPVERLVISKEEKTTNKSGRGHREHSLVAEASGEWVKDEELDF